MIAVVVQVSESLSQEKAPMVDIEGTDAPGEAEVIDLEDYVFRFCTCSVESMTDPSPLPHALLASLRVALAHPAVSSCKRRAEVEVESPAPLSAAENAAWEAQRRYTTHHYYRLPKAQLALQTLAPINLRRSSRL